MDYGLTSQKIKQTINQADNILLVAHQQPDADAIGSLVAFGHWLDFLGKPYRRFCVTEAPRNLDWLTVFHPITSQIEVLNNDYDLVVVLDCGDLDYAGIRIWLDGRQAKPIIINIDHHATNQLFGDINLLDSKAVSTTQILYQLFDNLNFKIVPPTASAILAGIIYDTYNFTNPNTNYESLNVAAGLLLAGASLPQVSDSILKNKTIEILKIWGRILARLRFNPIYGVAATVITERDFEGIANRSEVTEGIANFLNNITGINAALILEQQPGGTIKGSWRTNSDLIDVAKLAKILGGGGHRKAAGFKLNGCLKIDNGVWNIE
ncbi:MAG: bifunctional oligoribonuclease/PAP phosphatase NrnA [Patescibacteria group bacterium]|jgi:phosphoesterase RecJ-like protein|nr:bifunctional oligoribonuclease/PAP phosphatase NrnA [Patescibacteria group bacterium]